MSRPKQQPPATKILAAFKGGEVDNMFECRLPAGVARWQRERLLVSLFISQLRLHRQQEGVQHPGDGLHAGVGVMRRNAF